MAVANGEATSARLERMEVRRMGAKQWINSASLMRNGRGFRDRWIR
jgi:hypothetical protein